MESIAVHELVSSLCGISCFRVGRDRAGGEQSFFYIMPATRHRMSVGSFLGNGGGALQLRIDPRIHMSRRMNNRFPPVITNNAGRYGVAGKVKPGARRGQTRGPGNGRRKDKAQSTKRNQGSKLSHAG